VMLSSQFKINKTSKFSVFSAADEVQEVVHSSSGQSSQSNSTRPASVQPVIEEVNYDALTASVTKQSQVVRELKKQNVTGPRLEEEINKLKELKIKLAQFANLKQSSPFPPINRTAFEELIKRKMFVVPSFEIHGAVGGLFDLGPPACAVKANLINLWRKHFVLQENMLEMECTNLTPEVVLKTSGHVDKFTDFMVKDSKTGECFRADKLLEDFIDNHLEKTPNLSSSEIDELRLIQRQADSYSKEELQALFQRLNITSPAGNELTEPFAFNLMFKTNIGPEGTSVGYLRPETAQGLFVNFRRLLDLNQQRIPFAAAQIGTGFRNEISPRGGLIRVREFCMAEIEHFVHPNQKNHPKFADLANKELILFSSENQVGSGLVEKMTIGQAVRDGIVNNETLGYFMARTQLFFELIGINPQKIRFRQHLKTEMAHYACDCWDAEVYISDKWIECVGHADRACYDLQVHSKATNQPMIAKQMLSEPKLVDVIQIETDKKLIGLTFKKDQKKVHELFQELSEDEQKLAEFEQALETNGTANLGGFTIEKNMVKITKVKKNVFEEKFTPSVIEPSFGIGRVLYALLEHSFSQRENDEQRCVMSFKPYIAPIVCGIYPLMPQDIFVPHVQRVASLFNEAEITNKVDSSSGSIGKKYSRADEIGIPFGVTVDHETLSQNTVTLRERDSCAQVRIPINDLLPVVKSIVERKLTWECVTRKYPIVQVSENEEDNDKAAKSSASAPKTVIFRSIRGNFSRPAVPILNTC